MAHSMPVSKAPASKQCKDHGSSKYLFYDGMLKAVSRQIGRDRIKILDIGTGTGELAMKLAKEFPASQIVGIDSSDRTIGEARKRAQKAGITNVHFTSSPPEKLKSHAPNIVVSHSAFHHVKNKPKLVGEIYRSLPKNGKLVIADWFKPSKEYIRDVEKLRAIYPNSAGEFDRSLREFLRDSGMEGMELPTGYPVCPNEMSDIMKKAGFKKHKVVKLPIADFAVVVGIK